VELTSEKWLMAAAVAGIVLFVLHGHGSTSAPNCKSANGVEYCHYSDGSYSTCRTTRGGVEYCRWSNGGYSMTMPDGAFYTREKLADDWEHYYPEKDWQVP
jgi:hypothetical protein